MRTHERSFYLTVFILAFLVSPAMVSCNDEYSLKDINLENRNMEYLSSYQDSSCTKTFPFEELNVNEQSGLIYIREEEKLARDVYVLLSEQYALPVFNNISKSEQRHMDAVQNLLDKYRLEDPVSEDVPGKFKNAHLQELYDELIKKGVEGRLEALMVGALIEETDILDIQTELDQAVDNQDIKFVYSNLLRGSKNHLKTFVKWIHSYDIIYEPVLLTPNQVKKIVGDL